ncbi:NACHT and WD domain protein [Diaporthe sp. PMI_573]|nr:NACHT and WD domain protein [Diaporthaceae sp. PMI_573]
MFRKISTFGRKPSDESRQSQALRPKSDILRISPSPGGSQDADRNLPVPLTPGVLTVHDGDLTRKSSETDSGAFGLNVVYTPDHGHKADIVFVHGLGGTSRWTWSKNRDPDLFWPLTFLALEPDLCLARILTFGYNATLKKGGHAGQSVLDFAKDLLFDLKYATDERKEDLQMGKVPLIFVAHSMGGLIIKEAYMQGQHDPEYEDIIKSICAITFLATPHRGTQLAQTLNKILQCSLITNPKQYVADLASNSLTLQKLNEQFRHIAPRLDIVSFYETQPTAIGLSNNRIMVLEKDSSVLGYPGELSRALDADHHGVCKYDGPTDPNYVTVRNVLKSIVSKIVARKSGLEPTSHQKTSKDVKTMLAITELPDTDYIFYRDQWTQGTNSWILEDKRFLNWSDIHQTSSIALWLTGGPATGKSVLASFIINHLMQQGKQCQYFFIRFSAPMKRGLSYLLRSVAYQMAQSMPQFQRNLAELEDEGINFESASPGVIWDRVFKSIPFTSEQNEPIYWIVDGLDEADDPRVLIRTLLDFLSSLMPIRILFTSRRISEIQNSLMKASKNIACDEISIEGHTNDLFSYIRQELELAGEDQFKRSIEQRLLNGAQNNFLWVRLAVDRINSCHRQADVEDALKELPDGMGALYDRMAASILNISSHRDKALAISVLQCLTCSLRPLKVAELGEAAAEDISEMLNFEGSILDLCAGFVVIDNDGYASLIHQTACEYLTSDRINGLPQIVRRDEAHAHMFHSCMQCLLAAGLRAKFKRGDEPKLLEYATRNWSYHLLSSPLDDDETFQTLRKFLTGQSVLAWIHILAANDKLRTLIQASRHLSRYCRKKRDKPMPNDMNDLGTLQVELASSWANDLVKIVGKFGSILRRDAEAIYKLVPPFCARNSAIYQQFGKPESKSIDVSGQSTDTWDDLTTRISFGAYMSTISAASTQLAILNTRGNVILYDSADFQESSCSPIQHRERVYRTELSSSATLLATYGYNTVKIWELPSGLCKYTVPSVHSKPRPLAMRFSRNNKTLFVGTDDKKVRSLNLASPEPSWELTAELEELEMEGHFLNAANHIALNDDVSLIAIAYRGHPLSAWETEGPTHIGHCWRKRDELARGDVIEAMWHPFDTKVIGLYMEGDVFKWNPYDGEVEELPTGASKLALNRDGSLLATGDVHGKIKVYVTAGFSLLYQLASQDTVFGITFSPDSRRLYDIRGYYGNAWEPNALAEFMERPGKDADSLSETESLTQSSSVAPNTALRVDTITALAASPSGDLYIYGTDKGTVTLSSIRKGNLGEIHKTNAFFSIDCMAWSDDGKFLAFSDSSKKIFVSEIAADSDSLVERRAEISVKNSTKGPIFQLAFSPDSNSLFVQSLNAVHTICIAASSITQSHQLDEGEVTWIRHPREAHRSLGFGLETIYLLDSNSSKVQYLGYDLAPHVDRLTKRTVDAVLPTNDGKQVLVQFSVRDTRSSRKVIGSFDVTSICTTLSSPEHDDPKHDVKMRTVTPNILSESISSEVTLILSFISQSRLVFLSRDLSICVWQYQQSSKGSHSIKHNAKGLATLSAAKVASKPFKEIFYLPSDWVSKDCVALCTAWRKERSILFPRNGKVGVVRCVSLS